MKKLHRQYSTYTVAYGGEIESLFRQEKKSRFIQKIVCGDKRFKPRYARRPRPLGL